ncbi:hypothetical protein C8Q79DRAFT_156961 [Trametes meyenii]|nr:hypothetical protein C8Q79DRAFT_156961 [Trametes meyenii]
MEEHHDITVCQLVHAGESLWTESQEQALRDNASVLVSNLNDGSKWFYPHRVETLSFCFGRQQLQFTRDPPKCPLDDHAQTKRANIKEWECIVNTEDDEVWCLEDLEEFDHGVLRRLSEQQQEHEAAKGMDERDNAGCQTRKTKSTEPSTDKPTKRTLNTDTDSLPATKRVRQDEGPLCSVIPFPHIYPTLMSLQDPWSELPDVEFYRSPTPISPHNLATMEALLDDPFGRLAWVVPIRGQLPWRATSASILAEIQTDSHSALQGDAMIPQAPYANSSTPAIIWTRDAVNQFWQFLKQVRDTGNLGPVSLAFCTVPSTDTASSLEQFSSFGSHKLDTASVISSSVDGGSLADIVSEFSRPCLLRDCGYIKIYHDAGYTKFLRNILNAWSYRQAAVKIRVLKGASLALLDERGKGLLLC